MPPRRQRASAATAVLNRSMARESSPRNIAPAAAPINARGSLLAPARSAALRNLAAVAVVSPRNNPDRPIDDLLADEPDQSVC